MQNYPNSKHLIVMNRTKSTVLGESEIADTFFSRLRGTMFKKELKRGLILKLPSSRSRSGSAIHMFFVRFPLDIIFADVDKKVVDIISIDPWKTYTPKNPAKYVIEMEKGTIESSGTEIGDELDFTCENAK
ncbi:DUF192 domain-containing protein [Methanobacterium sp.]|jgi:uncharacterized membrane protein (UPF0127 family)|uniref:DUF192 domain-containing protein n=1 Tax=Methanobacterium sp. TaxID=2164 RepID=UPI0031592488